MGENENNAPSAEDGDDNEASSSEGGDDVSPPSVMTPARCVYKYGVTAPQENAALVFAQHRSAHRYRNTLTEIERGRRSAVRAMHADLHPDLRVLEVRVEQTDEAVGDAARMLKNARSKSRSRNDSTLLIEAHKAAKDVRKAARKALAEKRREVREDPAITDALDAINERALELGRSARGHCETFWGSYLLVEAAAKQAFATTPIYNGHEPQDPRFERFDGTGTVGVQIQGGMTIAEACSGMDTRLRITVPPDGAWDRETIGRSERERRCKQGQLKMRIGSNGRAPIWATWRLDMHRPLPENAIIKEVAVHCERVGPHMKWSVTFTLDTSACAPRPVPKSKGEVVGLDIGWRVKSPVSGAGASAKGSTLRVAAWNGSDGRKGELVLDARTIEMLREPETLRSQRDDMFNRQKADLARRLALAGDKVPAWLKKETAHLHMWRTPARFARLMRLHQEHALSAGERDSPTAKGILNDGRDEAFLMADRAMWAQEASRRRHALLRRREIYRVFSAKLVEHYETIVIEGRGEEDAVDEKPMDLRPLVERPEVAPSTAKHDAADHARDEAARSWRFIASTSELRTSILNAARSRIGSGRKVAAEPAEDTTRTCNVCGLIEDRPVAEAIEVVCSGCATVLDQDDNAGIVLRTRYVSRPGGQGAKILVPAPRKLVTETRRDRMLRLRKEKEERMERASLPSAERASANPITKDDERAAE
jgi:hypothetical protein